MPSQCLHNLRLLWSGNGISHRRSVTKAKPRNLRQMEEANPQRSKWIDRQIHFDTWTNPANRACQKFGACCQFGHWSDGLCFRGFCMKQIIYCTVLPGTSKARMKATRISTQIRIKTSPNPWGDAPWDGLGYAVHQLEMRCQVCRLILPQQRCIDETLCFGITGQSFLCHGRIFNRLRCYWQQTRSQALPVNMSIMNHYEQ